MRIPSGAKRVFNGIIFDVYQWEQEMFDGSKETFEMLKRPDTVQILPTQDETILYAKEEQPGKGAFTTVFGGRVDEDEDPLAAAKRELREEAGLASNEWGLLYRYEPSTKMDWTIYQYVARNCKKVQQPTLDAGEKIIVKSADFETFFTTVITSEHFRAQDLAFAMIKMKFLEPEKFEEFKKKLFLK